MNDYFTRYGQIDSQLHSTPNHLSFLEISPPVTRTEATMGPPTPGTTTTAASLLVPPTPPVITTIVSPQPVTTPAAATVQASLADPVVLIHRTPAGGSDITTTVWTSAGRGTLIGRGTLPARPAPAGRGNSFIQSPAVTQTLHNTPTTQVITSTLPLLC